MKSTDKFLMVLTVLLALIMGVKMVNKTPTIQEEEITSVSYNQKQELKTKLTESEAPLDSPKPTQLQQAPTQQQDPDEYLQTRLLLQEQTGCLAYLDSKKNDGTARAFANLKNNLSESQIDYFDKYYEYCEQLKESNPSFGNLKQLSRLKDIESSDPWSQLLKREIKQEDLSEDEIEGFLAQNSLQVLSEAPTYLNKYYQDVMHWDLTSVLQNHHYPYVQKIMNTAHQKYLCDLGMHCDENSTYMMYLCYEFEESCGLSFYQYIETLFTHSQQADLALANAFLSQKYNPVY